MDIGTVGMWFVLDAMTAPESIEFAQKIEKLGYNTLWIPEGFGRAVRARSPTTCAYEAANHRHRNREYLGARSDDDGCRGQHRRGSIGRPFPARNRRESQADRGRSPRAQLQALQLHEGISAEDEKCAVHGAQAQGTGAGRGRRAPSEDARARGDPT